VLTISPAALIPKAPPPPERTYSAPTPVELSELKRALDLLPVQDYEYDEWRDVVFAIHSVDDGPDGLLLADEWSARSSKHDSAFLENEVWPYARADRERGITSRTIFAKARKHGYQEDVSGDFEVIAEPPPDPAKVERFKRYSVSELLQRPPPKWIVRGVIPDAEIGVIYGASGSGKSFIALDLMAAIDQGVDWRGCRTRKSRIVIVVAEGAGGFRNRVEAYQKYFGVSLGIEVITAAPNLLDEGDMKALAASLGLSPVDIIVLDTLAQVTPGADENSGKDMGKALSQCKRLRALTGALVLLVHHSGKDAARGQRGWSGLKAACDFELEVTREGEDRTLEVSKLKDGAGESTRYGFRLHSVSLGVDEVGDPIDSCICDARESGAKGKTKKRREPAGPVQKVIWRLAHDLVDLGDGTVDYGVLRQHAFEQMQPVMHKSKGYDRREEQFQLAIIGLQAGGFMSILNNVVTLK